MLYYNNPMDYSEAGASQNPQVDCYSNPYQTFNCPYANNDMYRTANMPNMPMSPNPSILPTLPNSWDLGPIKIEWAFDGSSINMILSMFEKAVKDVVLSMAKPMVSITTDIGDTTINLKVNADFVNNFVAISGAVCFDTVCTTFNNTVIARW